MSAASKVVLRTRGTWRATCRRMGGWYLRRGCTSFSAGIAPGADFWVFPLLAAYARHAGFDFRAETLKCELRRRLSFSPAWAKAAIALSAVWLRWAAPLLYIGRPGRFENLNEENFDRLLSRLQQEGRLVPRALFLNVKTLILACCYAHPEFLAKIGYRRGGSSQRDKQGSANG